MRYPFGMKLFPADAVVCVGLLLSSLVWASNNDGTCKEVASDADVVFRATALETYGADTTMGVLQVDKGEMPSKEIIFRHAIPREELEIGFFNVRSSYYRLQQGHIYLVFAKKTTAPNIFSQLWGAHYCSESVQESRTQSETTTKEPPGRNEVYPGFGQDNPHQR